MFFFANLCPAASSDAVLLQPVAIRLIINDAKHLCPFLQGTTALGMGKLKIMLFCCLQHVFQTEARFRQAILAGGLKCMHAERFTGRFPVHCLLDRPQHRPHDGGIQFAHIARPLVKRIPQDDRRQKAIKTNSTLPFPKMARLKLNVPVDIIKQLMLEST